MRNYHQGRGWGQKTNHSRSEIKRRIFFIPNTKYWVRVCCFCTVIDCLRARARRGSPWWRSGFRVTQLRTMIEACSEPLSIAARALNAITSAYLMPAMDDVSPKVSWEINGPLPGDIAIWSRRRLLGACFGCRLPSPEPELPITLNDATIFGPWQSFHNFIEAIITVNAFDQR